MKNGKWFRKMLSAVLCAAMVSGVGWGLGSPGNVLAAEPNVVENPSFEDSLTSSWLPWTADSEGMFEQSAEKKSDGSYSLKLTGEATGKYIGVKSPYISVTAGDSFDFAMDFYGENGADSFIYVKYYNDSNQEIVPSPLHYTRGTGNGSWQTLICSVTVPAGATKAYLLMTTNRGHADTIYFDKAQFIKTGPLSGEVPAAAVVNPSFEDMDGTEIAGWHAWGAKKHEQSDEQHSVGLHSLKIIDDDNNGVAATESVRLIAQGGKSYRATIDCYGVGSATGQLYLQFFDRTGTRIGVPFANSVGHDQWSRITVEGVAPIGTAYATIMAVSHKAQVGVLYFDNASYREADSPEYPSAIQNGSFEEAGDTASDAANWSKLAAGDSVVRNDEKASDGIWSIKMTDLSNNGGCGYRSDPVAVTPGENYEAKADIYLESGTADLYLEYWDGFQRLTPVWIGSVSSTGRWVTAKAEGECPDSAIYATVLVYQNKGNVGTLYADHISLVAKPVLREYPILVTTHPRLFFTTEEVPSLVTRANDDTTNAFGYSGKGTFDAIKAKADAFLTETSFTLTYYGGLQITYDLPPTQPPERDNPPGFVGGPYPYWTALGKALQERLQALSLSYVVTGNEAYANKAIEYALSISNWNLWSDPQYSAVTKEPSCLDTAHITMGMSTVYDMLYDYMTDAQRTQIKNALVTKGLDNLYIDAAKKVDQNIYMLRASALGMGACAVAEPALKEKTDRYLTRAIDFYTWYLDERYESGNQEGYLYTSYALEAFIQSVDQISRVTGQTDLINHPYFDEMFVKWVANFAAPGSGTLPAFSDSSETAYFFNTMSILNKWRNDGDAGYYLANSRPSGGLLERFLYTNDNPAISTPEESLKNVCVMDQIGYGALRTGWSNEDMLLAMISNNSRLGHNHYDQNSFQLAFNGLWMASDAGYADFSTGTPKNEFTTWRGHNTIYVDGNTQTVKGNGSLKEKVASSLYGHMVGSAPNAYNTGVLSRFDRHAILVNHETNPYYILIDDLKSSTARTYGWHLYTSGWNQFSVDGIDRATTSTGNGNSIAIAKSGQNLYAQFVGSQPLSITSGMYRQTEGPSIMVNSPSKAEYQFMSVLNAAVSSGEITAASIMDTVTTNNSGEVKTVAVDGVPCVFFRASAAEDAITFTFPVDEAGSYDLNLTLPKSPAYGNYQMYLDGTAVGSVYSGYAADVVMSSHSLGNVTLTQGNHTLTMKCVGKDNLSTGYLISLATIQYGDGSSSGSIPASQIEILENYDTASVLGAKIGYAAGKNDIILFNRSDSASMSAADVITDAKESSILGVENTVITEGFGASDVTTLTFAGSKLFEAASKASVAADFRTSGTTTYEVASDTAQTVKVYAEGVPASITVNGETASFTMDGSLAVISVTKGQNTIVIQ